MSEKLSVYPRITRLLAKMVSIATPVADKAS